MLAVLTLLSGISWPMILFLAVLLVWSANLYNFMDGADGLAGGMTFIGFGILAYAFFVSGCHLEAMACLIIGASGLGFLLFNFYPARIFMGDNGSIPIGFLAGWFSIWGYFHSAWPVSFPILVFFPFLADATLTLLRRVMRGEAFWRAHREHGYQRLIQMGWSHRQVSLAYYLWMLMTGFSGLMVLQVADLGKGVEIILLVSWSIIAMAIIGRVGRLSMDHDIGNK
jgi:UDP-N-acetylmuramyl pentapeptide phosphotransferase/UDP-N-acetylglucosamine-1-phosphate transferase